MKEELVKPDDVEMTEPPKTPILPNVTQGMSPTQLFVCQLVAEHKKPSEILELCADTLARGEIKESWIRHMCSPADRPQKFQPVIEHFRQLAWERRGDVPVCDPVQRARERQGIIDRNRDRNDGLVLQVLQDAERVYGQTGDGQADVSVQVNVGRFRELERLAASTEPIEVVPGIQLPTSETAEDHTDAAAEVDEEPRE